MALLNLFQLILRNGYDQLPPVVQQFHEARLGLFEGEVIVTGANTALARLVRRLGGLPAPTAKCPIVLRILRSEFKERWLRQIANTEFASTFTRTSKTNLLCETFGMFKLFYTLHVHDKRITWHCLSWSFAGIPLPDGLSPEVEAWEGATTDGRYQFKMNLQFPVVGHVLGYEGTLTIATAQTAASA